MGSDWESGGWIRLHRKLIESQVFTDAGVLKVWIWCLFRANWKPAYWRDEHLQPGDFVCGTHAAAEELQTTAAKFRLAMKKLQDWGLITRKTTNKYTVVSVINWRTYQHDARPEQQTNDKQTTNKQQTNDKQTTTVEEGNNTKKVNTHSLLNTSKEVKEEKEEEVRAPENSKKEQPFWRHPLPPRMAKNEKLQTAWDRWCDYSFQQTGRKLEPAYAEAEIKRMCEGAILHRSVDPVIAVIDRSIAKRSRFLFLDDLFAGTGSAGSNPIRGGSNQPRDLAMENTW